MYDSLNEIIRCRPLALEVGSIAVTAWGDGKSFCPSRSCLLWIWLWCDRTQQLRDICSWTSPCELCGWGFQVYSLIFFLLPVNKLQTHTHIMDVLPCTQFQGPLSLKNKHMSWWQWTWCGCSRICALKQSEFTRMTECISWVIEGVLHFINYFVVS